MNCTSEYPCHDLKNCESCKRIDAVFEEHRRKNKGNDKMKRVYRKNYLDKLPPNTKLVARPNKKYGNPYKLSDYSIDTSLKLYAKWLTDKIQADSKYLESLKGFDLACYCKLDQKCHADIIINFMEFLN